MKISPMKKGDWLGRQSANVGMAHCCYFSPDLVPK